MLTWKWVLWLRPKSGAIIHTSCPNTFSYSSSATWATLSLWGGGGRNTVYRCKVLMTVCDRDNIIHQLLDGPYCKKLYFQILSPIQEGVHFSWISTHTVGKADNWQIRMRNSSALVWFSFLFYLTNNSWGQCFASMLIADAAKNASSTFWCGVGGYGTLLSFGDPSVWKQYMVDRVELRCWWTGLTCDVQFPSLVSHVP